MSTEPLPPARKQRPRVNDAAVDAAIEAIRGGATLEQAAASIGMSGNSLARRLYKRGTSVLALRPPVPAPHPERTRTYGECYYCQQPLRQPGGIVCSRRECQYQRKQDRLRADPALLAAENAWKNAWAAARRRAAGEREIAPRVEGGRQAHVTIHCRPEDRDLLRAHAELRGISVSRLVIETLEDAGLLRPLDDGDG